MAELSHVSTPESAVVEVIQKANRLNDGAVFPNTIKAGWFDAPVGAILFAGDDDALCLVSYLDQTSTIRKAALIQKKLQAKIELGSSRSVDALRHELEDYFAGTRRDFASPLAMMGTVFQNKVWETLRKIPFGTTITYTELAVDLGKPSAFRAVAQANAQNPMAIVVPCHRVINSDGDIGGYSAGVEKKTWLLNYEREVVARSAPSA